MKASIVNDRGANPKEFLRGQLYINKNRDIAVLCTETNHTRVKDTGIFSGVVIVSDGGWPIGHYSEGWSAEAFTPFSGKIELEQ